MRNVTADPAQRALADSCPALRCGQLADQYCSLLESFLEDALG